MTSANFDVFGQRVLVTRRDGGWSAFYTGDEGKKRLATDIVIPAEFADSELRQYLANLCQE